MRRETRLQWIMTGPAFFLALRLGNGGRGPNRQWPRRLVGWTQRSAGLALRCGRAPTRRL